LVNRPGNAPSHLGAAAWIDRALALVQGRARKILLRGDTDFSLTGEFDRWSAQADFLLGMDAHPTLVALAEGLPEAHWRGLATVAKQGIKTQEREKPERIKEQIVHARGYLNQRLESEQVAELDYRPVKCKRSYRVVVVRKNISVEKGEAALFDELRYFFYITTRRDLSGFEVVQLAHERCDQENVIAQLKGGVNALRMPVNDLMSNWAYMVMAALAWNLKAWYGLLLPCAPRGQQILKMEFRRFLHALILLPAQILCQGRKLIYRILGYNDWLVDFFAMWEYLRKLKPA
jgi:hypothetical protein